MQELGLKRVCAAWVLSVRGLKSGLTDMPISPRCSANPPWQVLVGKLMNQGIRVLLPLVGRGRCLSAMRVYSLILGQPLYLFICWSIKKILTLSFVRIPIPPAFLNHFFHIPLLTKPLHHF